MKNITQHVARLQRALTKFTDTFVAEHIADAIAAIPQRVQKASTQATKAVAKVVKKKAAKKAGAKDVPQTTNSYHDAVLTFLKGRDPLPLKDIASGCDMDIGEARVVLAALRKSKAVQTQGEKRGMKYHLAG